MSVKDLSHPVDTVTQPVFILMETGFIVRNLLLGTFAESLADRAPILIAVPDPHDPRLHSALPHPQIQLTQYLKPDPSAIDGIGALLHFPSLMYRVKQVEKASASMALQTKLFDGGGRVGRQKQLTREVLLGVSRVVKAAGANGWLDSRYLEAIRGWTITRQWHETFRARRPCAVISTMLTHALPKAPSYDLPAVVAAHDLGIPVGTLVQSWDNLSSKSSLLPPWLDAIWTWSAFMRDELREFHPRVPIERVAVVGSPQFDFHRDPGILQPRQTFMRALDLDPARPMIVIGTGTAVWLPQEPQIVATLIRDLRTALPDCQILVRLHPKDHGERWTPFRTDLEREGVVLQMTSPETHMDAGGFIPPLDFYREQVNTLHHAAVVLNTASTLTVDAAIVDCPVISLGYDIVPDDRFPEGRAWAYNNSTHFGNLVKTGGVWVVRSQEECVTAVKAYLADRGLHRAGRARIVEIAAGTVDGGAGERLADAVLALSESTRALV
ncbi:MAG: hypothetical protein SGJ24_03985 [Chloroflexota bacterium]|nr:hypothetical protein [Chloroflexota bacterium]